MATLKTYQSSEMPPRRKIRYFQFALLRMARLMYTGPGTTAGYISATQYAAIDAFYKKPFRRAVLTSGSDLLPWAKAATQPGGAGQNYRIGDILTLVQTGASGGKVVVARISATGGVTAVLPLVPGTGYKAGFATTTAVNSSGAASSGTGAVIGLRAVYGTVVDVLDQVRVDVQNIAAGQTSQLFGPNVSQGVGDGYGVSGNARQPGTLLTTGGSLAQYSEAYNIKDWGNPNTTMRWLTSITATTSIGSPGAYAGGTSYVPGMLATNGGSTYMCYRAITGTAPTAAGIPNGLGLTGLIGPYNFCKILGIAAPAAGTDPYWVILPNGGTKNAGQLLNPIGVTIASMVGRTAAVLQGICLIK